MRGLFLAMLLAPILAQASLPADKELELCTSTKEYVTTLNYLLDKKEFSLKKEDAMNVAEEVSKGCSGSAKQFILTLDLLLKVELSTADAIKVAKKVSLTNRDKAWAFRSILKNSYASNKLDLAVKDSVDYAMKLSVDFEGDARVAHSDFETIVNFCKGSESLDLPTQKCAQLAYNVSHLTGKFHKPLAKTFVELFTFMTDGNGPGLTTFKAIEMSENLINFGPEVLKNFKLAYKYATSENGLDMERARAISFSKKMAESSFRNLSGNNNQKL